MIAALAAILISVQEWLAIGTFVVSTYTIVVQPILRKPVVVAAKTVSHVVVHPVRHPVKMLHKIEGKG